MGADFSWTCFDEELFNLKIMEREGISFVDWTIFRKIMAISFQKIYVQSLVDQVKTIVAEI